MTNAGDSAEQVVRLSLEGVEVIARITGAGAKNVMALLYTVMKDKTKTAGKTNLSNMLKTGKELKIFSIKAEDLCKFKDEAKKYGVLYSTLLDRKGKKLDGMVDVFVRAEDASKINRIVERFELAGVVDTAKIKSEVEKTKVNPQSALTEKETPSKHISKSRAFTKPSVKKELDRITKEMYQDGKIPILTKENNKGVRTR